MYCTRFRRARAAIELYWNIWYEFVLVKDKTQINAKSCVLFVISGMCVCVCDWYLRIFPLFVTVLPTPKSTFIKRFSYSAANRYHSANLTFGHTIRRTKLIQPYKNGGNQLISKRDVLLLLFFEIFSEFL